jgi:hypothetical protein
LDSYQISGRGNAAVVRSRFLSDAAAGENIRFPFAWLHRSVSLSGETMTETTYRNRRAYSLDNGTLEIFVTVEGGHIAAVSDKASGISPLWSPPWPSIEPSKYDRQKHPEYGADSESKLLSGILGHNLCLDIFGGPSEAEAAAGMTVHGEAPVAVYDIKPGGETLTQSATLQQAQLRFLREIRLPRGQRVAEITETVENLTALDRPVAWTQHATLGPPFLEKGRTQFRITATKSKVIEHDFTGGKGYMKIGAEFNWPLVPRADGGTEDMRVFTNRTVSGAYSTHLVDPSRPDAWFLAWSPTHRLAFGYVWKVQDFPWLGIWEENLSRTQPPWNGVTLTRGMEFGVSPFPETRQAMIQRGSLFGVPGYRWIPARRSCTVHYKVFLVPADSIPEGLPI